jgi:hypothetical protein
MMLSEPVMMLSEPVMMLSEPVTMLPEPPIIEAPAPSTTPIVTVPGGIA